MLPSTSHGAPGPAFSLDSWILRLKSWFHPDRFVKSKRPPSHNEKTPRATTFNAAWPFLCSPLSLDLPSPTISVSFAVDSELSIDTESEFSSTESSRCPTPIHESHPYPEAGFKSTHRSIVLSHIRILPTENATTSQPAATPINASRPLDFSRDAFLAKYSHQELVLLEFLTHTSDIHSDNIDEVLFRYPPGFSNTCRCANSTDEGNSDFCEVCQLVDAYMAYSLERFQET